MDWKDRIEQQLAWITIPSLIRYVAVANLLVFVLAKLVPEYLGYLTLNPTAILHGQVWRLLSWMLVPQTMSFFWILFSVMWLWFLGDFLEAAWGSFRANIFFWLGVAGCTVGAFLAGTGGGVFNWYLNLSILFAFATLDPDHPVYFFFIPIKAKWLGWLSAGFVAVTFLVLPLRDKAALLLSFVNYFLFFGPALWREARQTRKAKVRRNKFVQAQANDQTLHCCHICGVTEVSDPETDFRVSNDGYEYCSLHLPTARQGYSERRIE